MGAQDWHLAIPRSPEVGRVQQLAATQGEAVQEHLARVDRVQVRQTPRVKEDTGPSPVRQRGDRGGRGGRLPRRGAEDQAATRGERDGRSGHLDVLV